MQIFTLIENGINTIFCFTSVLYKFNDDSLLDKTEDEHDFGWIIRYMFKTFYYGIFLFVIIVLLLFTPPIILPKTIDGTTDKYSTNNNSLLNSLIHFVWWIVCCVALSHFEYPILWFIVLIGAMVGLIKALFITSPDIFQNTCNTIHKIQYYGHIFNLFENIESPSYLTPMFLYSAYTMFIYIIFESESIDKYIKTVDDDVEQFIIIALILYSILLYIIFARITWYRLINPGPGILNFLGNDATANAKYALLSLFAPQLLLLGLFIANVYHITDEFEAIS